MEKESSSSTTKVVDDGVNQQVETVNVRPEEYVCFGTMDANHPECQQCQFNKQCSEKTAGK